MTGIFSTFNGRNFHKASRCNDGWCLYLPAEGPLDAVADSKTSQVLAIPAGQLVAFAKAWPQGR